MKLPQNNKIPTALSLLLSLPLMYFTNSLSKFNADDVVPGLMSVENWTPFFWGQDRLGGFIPFVSQPITSLAQNIHFQNYLHVSLLLVFIIFAINQFSKLSKPYLNYILLLLLATLSLVLWPHQFYSSLPYADSFGLSALSVFMAQRIKKSHVGYLLFIVPLFILFIANWVNPLVTLYLLPVYLCYLVLFTNQFLKVAIHFIISLTFGLIFIVYGINKGETSGLSLPSLQVFSYLHVVLPLALVQVVSLVTLIVDWAKGRFSKNRFLLLVISLVTWPLCLLISTSNWVRLNLYEPRYFIPIIFTALVCNVIFITSGQFSPTNNFSLGFETYRKKIIFGILFLLLGLNCISFLGISKSVPLDKPWIDIVQEAMKKYPDASFAIGNYWYSWPTKFFEKEPSTFPVLAHRMEGQKLFERTNWNKLKSIIKSDSRGICFGPLVGCEIALRNYELLLQVPKNEHLKLVSVAELTFNEVEVNYVNLQAKPSTLRASSGIKYSFANTGDGVDGLYAGWSEPEAWGVWSSGKTSTIEFVYPKQVNKDQFITFEGIQFPDGTNDQRLDIRANGIRVGTYSFSETSRIDSFRVMIPAYLVNERNGVVSVTISYSNPVSPKSLNLSTDDRVIAFGLVSVRFD